MVIRINVAPWLPILWWAPRSRSMKLTRCWSDWSLPCHR
ncbi:MAG: hypothetical protein AVDCRST_MAG66-2433 [uncultured Pseudonocardia sp.]|uniref:Uncharacterized protein n=1 Tax=uncultured Pseudonocardia sp. TaxID=211455 RepID=A0A6J4PI03_9PSEU|nr:MAG: hypothetical protein AVDCRST_MAG66-2433 [uncultured Pseudonocardia sp.]